MQARLVALLLSIVTAAWVMVAVATWFDARRELDVLLDSHLEQAASLVVAQQLHAIEEQARRIGRGHEHRDAREAPSVVDLRDDDDDDDDGDDGRKRRRRDDRSRAQGSDDARRHSPRVAFQVFHEGQLVLRSTRAPVQALLAAGADGFAHADFDGRRWRVFAVDAGHDLRIIVGEHARSRDAILGAVLRSTLAPMLVVLPLLGLALWWGVRRGLAPLGELRAQLATRDPQALQPVALDDAPAELEPVTAALDALFARIAALLDGERRFTADAAHELRTPIAAIRAQAQVALQATDAAVQRTALQRTLQGCDRAAHLVDQLLMLARLEADAHPVQSKVDLAAVLRRVVGDLAPHAISRSQQLVLDAPPTLPVRGHETLLAALLRNLVDNAIRYTGEGGHVRVVASVHEERVRVEVEDDGPGMAADERARLGERFFRVLGHEAGGSGLGWSIVRRIARLHELAVEVTKGAHGRGLCVALEWPPA